MFRRLLLAMALAVSAAVFVPTGPANAAGQEITFCVWVEGPDGRLALNCRTIIVPEIGPNPPGPIECLTCPPAIDLWDNTDLKVRWEYQDLLIQGLQLLSKAANTMDPDESKKLRAEATDTFLASAGKLGKNSALQLDQRNQTWKPPGSTSSKASR